MQLVFASIKDDLKRQERKHIRAHEGFISGIFIKVDVESPEKTLDEVEAEIQKLKKVREKQKFRDLNKETYMLGFKHASEELRDKVLEIPFRDTDDQLISMITERTVRSLKLISEDIKLQIMKELQEGYMLGEGNEELARRIERVWGTGRVRARRLARTETSEVYNQGHLRAYENSGVVKYVEFIATLDERTSPICSALHGTVWPVGSPDIQRPPLHFNCRSRLVAYFGRPKAPKKIDPSLIERVRHFRTTYWDMPEVLLPEISKEKIDEVAMLVAKSPSLKYEYLTKSQAEALKQLDRIFESREAIVHIYARHFKEGFQISDIVEKYRSSQPLGRDKIGSILRLAEWDKKHYMRIVSNRFDKVITAHLIKKRRRKYIESQIKRFSEEI